MSLPQYLMGQSNGWDFTPIENALAKYADQKRWQAQQAMAQRRMGMEEARFRQESEFHPLKMQQFRGNLRQQDFDYDAGRQKLPLELGALRERNAASAQDRQFKANMHPVEMNLKRSHADLYGAQADWARRRGDIAEGNAQTQRQKVWGDILNKFQANHSQTDWLKENEPGGIIHTAFGRPIPWEQRGYVLAQAKTRNAPVDQQQLIEQGFTPEDAREMAQQKALTQTLGKPEVGHRWMKNPQGKWVQERIAQGKGTVQGDQTLILAKAGLAALDEAQRILERSGTAQQLAGDQWRVPGGRVGGMGEAGRGFRSARMALLNLNFAMSGKSVSNAEREAFLDLYMPVSTDSRASQDFKFRKIREFFKVVIDAKGKGATDDDIAALYRRALADPDIRNPGARPEAPPNSLKQKYNLE